MHAKLLIDAIMRQTTVLIAQLSAAAGIRAPLSHLADEVFLNLSQELESQGVGRKVVADMFGMALRGYQRRVQRLRESQTDGGKTLWQATAEFLHQEGQVTRLQLLNRFGKDDPDAVAAVLSDLVRTGLISRIGSGPSAVFAPTPEESRKLLAQAGKKETLHAIVWLDICQHPHTPVSEIAARVRLETDEVENVVSSLCADGQVCRDDSGSLVADAFVIPVGAEAGWEAAVLDHFQAVAGAIAAKLRQGVPRSAAGDTTGGATLGFEVNPQHPLYPQVMDLLADTRKRTGELWDAVEDENRKRPIAEDETERVVFYFGQFVKKMDEDA